MQTDDYDYIIVGAGSAGCVLANRLSADPDSTVLLIEAGKKDRPLSVHVPGMLGEQIASDKNNWFYWTEPQKHMKNRKLFWPRGKILGGSSSINGLLYVRGHKRDYDEWAQLGCKGWSFDDVLPYFRKSEDFIGKSDDFHGTGGPLAVTPRTSTNPINDAFLASGQQAGLPLTPDFNGPEQEGVGTYQQTIKDGRRWSTATGFLKPVLERPNLTVLTEALTHKISFDTTAARPRATGVILRHKKQIKSITARKEVILCGGAINSPQLLMLSGIGDARDLQYHGITPVYNAPAVGQNLQDHIDTTVTAFCDVPITFKKWANPLLAVGELVKWMLKKPGVLSDAITPSGAFIKSDPALERPDIQLHLLLGLAPEPHGFAMPTRHGVGLHSCLLRPRSRGTIALASNNPEDLAKIDPNYFTDPHDLEGARKGVRLSAHIFKQPAFKKYISAFESPWNRVDTMSDTALDDIIREKAETIYHPVGTCAMGPADHGSSVVDPTLKVIGVSNLRVADASVMPRLIGGNTNAPTIMIAEKCADMILSAAQDE